MTKKTSYHHGDLRAALLDTTAKMIVEQGIHKVSMRSLSNMIGVSRTAPYRHFDDKEALLCAVAEHGFRRLGEKMRQAAASSGSAVSRFEKMAMAYVDFALANPAYYKLMFGKEMASDTPSEDLLTAAMATLEEAFTIIKECQVEGSFRKGNPNSLTNVVWSTLHGLVSLLIDGQIRSAQSDRGKLEPLSNGRAESAVKQQAKLAIKILVKGMS